MKKRKTFFQMVVFSALVCFGVTACGGGGNNQNSNSAQLEKITITAADNQKTLTLGQSVQLTASVNGVSWTSSQTGVATVNNDGLVTSVGAGTTTITASKNGYRDGTISIKVELEKIVVTASGSTELLIGGTVTLTANKDGVTWESSNAEIASVDQNGVVTANKLGDATITAKKQGFADGSQAIKVKRPEPTKVLHMEDAEHYAADGEWTSSNEPTEAPTYNKSNASDGTTCAHFGAGDKETIRFASSKAGVRAEIVLMIGYYYSVSDLTTIYDVKFNNEVVNFPAQSYTAEDTTNYTYQELSFGELTLALENTLEISMKENTDNRFPYMDDLRIYASEQVTITLTPAPTKDPVNVDKTSAEIIEGASVQINSTTPGVEYSSSNASVASVNATGLVRGISAGSANILVKKDGMSSAKVVITVTENSKAFKVEAESGTSDESNPVTFRDSQGSSGVRFTDSFPVGAVLTLNVTAEQAGDFVMTMAARGIRGSGYSYSAVNLKEAMELKVNGTEVDLTGKQVAGSSSIGISYLGDVALAATNTVTIKALGSMPTIDYLRFIPKA